MKTLKIFSITFIILSLNSCDRNKHAPQIFDQQFSVPENSETGTYIGTVEARDVDAGQLISYEIIDGNTQGTFHLDPRNGNLFVSNPEALDFETNTSFSITVSVSDNHDKEPLESSSSIQINILDENEFAPEMVNQVYTLDENPRNGQEIGTVNAEDGDIYQHLIYSLAGSSNLDYFDIHPSTGMLSVKDSTAFDYETNKQLNLWIKVSDSHPEAMTDSAVITVNIADILEITDGLVAFYPFDGNALDMTESALHGAVNGAIPTTDRDGSANSAYLFDGTNDYIALGSDFDLPERTVSFRFLAYSVPVYGTDPDNFNSWSSLLVSNHPQMQYGGFHIVVSNLDGFDKICAWKVGMYEVADLNGLAAPINKNTWHDVSFLSSSDSLKLYLDGALVATFETSVQICSQFGSPSLIVGAGRNLDLRFFDGRIDHIMIHNRLLDESEIRNLSIHH